MNKQEVFDSKKPNTSKCICTLFTNNKQLAMHIKDKYINAIDAALDFIEANVDGADEENNEIETRQALAELASAMRADREKKKVRYYVRRILSGKKV